MEIGMETERLRAVGLGSSLILCLCAIAGLVSAALSATSLPLLPAVFAAAFAMGAAGTVARDAELLLGPICGSVLGFLLVLAAFLRDSARVAALGRVGEKECEASEEFYAANGAYCTAFTALTLLGRIAVALIAIASATLFRALQRSLRQAHAPGSLEARPLDT